METTSMQSEASTEGWDINRADQLEWVPWGEGGARAKILGSADGYVVALVEADAGYHGTPHEHAYAEFFYLIDGDVTNQGTTMTAGDGYAAAAGTRHDEFHVETPARYLSIFKL
jgi:mannose-6-phosphate isomerase-like protein (cupin superfamily)